MLTELTRGKSIEDGKKITNKDVARALEGLPKNKMHCSNLGADALQLAIKDYEAKKSGKTKPEQRRKPETHIPMHKKEGQSQCYCPYCDAELSEKTTFCKSCQSDLDQEH